MYSLLSPVLNLLWFYSYFTFVVPHIFGSFRDLKHTNRKGNAADNALPKASDTQST